MLELRDVHYSYPDGHKAINGLSLTFPDGQAIGIVGANGAGKSTLLLLLLGVLVPDSGSILLDGVAITEKNVSLLRQRLGLAFQNPDDQLFMATVGEDVAFGPRNLRLGEREVNERVTEALEMVGMAHLRDRSPFKLSGGEKRAAAIATVLAMHPDMLILDGPTASLDPGARRRIITILSGFEHSRIITSHDLDMVWETCGRVVILRQGIVVADGKSDELLSDAPLLESCGLELPLGLLGCHRRTETAH